MMCSYAVVNNAASCASANLLQDGLYEQANYGGFVTSDWGAAGSAVGDANAGMAVAMPFSDASDITAALTAGTLSQTTVNMLVSEILTQMFAFGEFDNPNNGSLSATVTSAAHQQTALQMGEEGTVLLKNNGILPLNPNPSCQGVDRGDRHRRRRRRGARGGGSGGVDSSNTVWPLTGIQERGRAERHRHLHRRRRQRHHRHPPGGHGRARRPPTRSSTSTSPRARRAT